MVAATKAVAAPMMATVNAASGEAWSNGLTRHIRYTPAVTMVAAWIRAETGVGPSMASASQGNNGSWADLPAAPRNKSKVMAVMLPGPISERWEKTTW